MRYSRDRGVFEGAHSEDIRTVGEIKSDEQHPVCEMKLREPVSEKMMRSSVIRNKEETSCDRGVTPTPRVRDEIAMERDGGDIEYYVNDPRIPDLS